MKVNSRTIRFGVNYVPSKKWWYCWNDFQTDEIAADLDAIAGMGADHLRIMLIWPFFQPNRRWVSEAHLDRLDQFMGLARERGLDICVTLLTGWLSGWSFRPTFDCPTDFYTAEKLREPMALYFEKCAERLNRHANFIGFDLGNELNCCWRTANVDEGDAWMDKWLAQCAVLSPDRIHVNGVDHQPWFYPDTFSPTALAQRQSLIALHCWIEFTGARLRGGELDPVCVQLAPAMAALARAHAGVPDKPIWLQEFGASADWMAPARIPDFCEAATEAAIQGGISWITWWCSHDILPQYEFSPLEYDLGLIDVDNRLKPAGDRFKKLAAEWRGKPTLPPPALELPPLPDWTGIVRPATEQATWKWLETVQAQLARS